MGPFCSGAVFLYHKRVLNPPGDGRAEDFGNAGVQHRTFRYGRRLLNAFVRVGVAGREHLPASGPFLLAANHVSHFDPPLLTLAADRWIDWVAMSELYRHRWFAAYLRALAAIPLDRARRDRAAAVSVLRHLRAGRTVGIFPEGGIRLGAESVLGGGAMHGGACRLAVSAGVPIIPAVIVGSEKLYSAGSWLWRRRTFAVQVVFGPPLTPAVTGEGNKAQALTLNDLLATTLRGLNEQAAVLAGSESVS